MPEINLILGNSNQRFSGVTSTMLQVLPHQAKLTDFTIMGKHHVPAVHPTITFWQTLQLCKKPLNTDVPRVFHARRNDEMIQALTLKKLGANLRIIFTSTAQRHHSKFTQYLMSQMDGIITTCSAANHYLKNSADVIIPHGIDTERYHPVSNKQEAWRELKLPGAYGIGIFGRVRHQKGHDILLDAILPLLDKYPEPTVVIVGETKPSEKKFQEALLAKISQHGHQDRVHFLGSQAFRDIPKFMSAMSLVCALSRNEGFGLTIPEAMACETAVLASSEGAWEEIISEGHDGHIVPTSDVQATRSVLETLLQNPSQLLDMGKQGRKKVLTNFTVQQEAKRLCDFYHTVQHQ